MSKLEQTLRQHPKYKTVVNILDGAFFGLGWGLSSFGTIIPLFVSHLTQSATLVSLILAIHSIGWQLPQLFMVNAVAHQRCYMLGPTSLIGPSALLLPYLLAQKKNVPFTSGFQTP